MKEPSIEIGIPDITPYRKGNTGTEYVTSLDSGNPGAHVMINALTHGNEITGAHILCELLAANISPVRGKLTLSFANVAAFSCFSVKNPYVSRLVDEDFNRIWDDETLHGNRNSVELKRARELLPFVRQADYLLDLHSMHQPSPPLMLCGMQQRAVQLAARVGVPSTLIQDPGHASGKRMRDYGPFNAPTGNKVALLVECGQHWARESLEVCMQTTLRFLRTLDVLDPAFFAGRLGDDPLPKPQVLRVSEPVTIKTRGFHFVKEFQGMEVVKKAGTVIAYDGDEEIRTPHDNSVLIMPNRNLTPGLSAVRIGRMVELEVEMDQP